MTREERIDKLIHDLGGEKIIEKKEATKSEVCEELAKLYACGFTLFRMAESGKRLNRNKIKQFSGLIGATTGILARMLFDEETKETVEELAFEAMREAEVKIKVVVGHDLS